MPDVYATIGEVAPEIQERPADVIEMRAADPRMQAMFHAYLSEIEFPSEAKVLEIGCGTGAVTRTLARWPRVAEVMGPGLRYCISVFVTSLLHEHQAIRVHSRFDPLDHRPA